MVNPSPPCSSQVKTKLTNQRSRKHLRWKVTHGTPVSGTDWRTDGNPPTEASSCCLVGRARSGRSSWAFVCLPACVSSCDDFFLALLGRRWPWSRLPLRRPKGQVVLWCGRSGRLGWACGEFFVINHQIKEKTDIKDTNIVSKNIQFTQLIGCFPVHNALLAMQVYLWAFFSPSGFEPTYDLVLAQRVNQKLTHTKNA